MSADLTPGRHAFARNPGGVAEFDVWGTRDGNQVLSISRHIWRRPVTGRTEEGELIVKPESKFNVTARTVSDYLKAVFGEDLANLIPHHSCHYHLPNEVGPIGEAPQIHRADGAQ